MFIGRQNVLLSSASSTGIGAWVNTSDVDFINLTVINSTSANTSMRFIGLMGDPADAPSTSYNAIAGAAGTTSLPVYQLSYYITATSLTSSVPASTTIDSSGTVYTRMYRVDTRALTHVTLQITAGTSTGTSGTPMVEAYAAMYKD